MPVSTSRPAPGSGRLATRKPVLAISAVGGMAPEFDAARMLGMLLEDPPLAPRFEPLMVSFHSKTLPP